MKKLLSVLLTATLIMGSIGMASVPVMAQASYIDENGKLTTVAPSPPATKAPVAKTATADKIKVSANGAEPVEVWVYNIEGHNYMRVYDFSSFLGWPTDGGMYPGKSPKMEASADIFTQTVAPDVVYPFEVPFLSEVPATVTVQVTENMGGIDVFTLDGFTYIQLAEFEASFDASVDRIIKSGTIDGKYMGDGTETIESIDIEYDAVTDILLINEVLLNEKETFEANR